MAALVLFTVALSVASQEALKPDPKKLKFWNDHESGSVMQANHAQWQGLLDKYLDDSDPSGVTLFDYANVSVADKQALKEYINYLQVLEPRQFNLEESKAYWINFYNALLVDDILDAFENGPIESVREIRSGAFRAWPWTRKAAKVLFQELSLNDIEHNIIRPMFNDPRVHYVLAKGSVGGGSLLKTAFDGDNNEELLDQAEKNFLNHDRGVKITATGVTQLSSLFDWYAEDFAPNQAELISYISQNIKEELKEPLLQTQKVNYDYDWSLNSK